PGTPLATCPAAPRASRRAPGPPLRPGTGTAGTDHRSVSPPQQNPLLPSRAAGHVVSDAGRPADRVVPGGQAGQAVDRVKPAGANVGASQAVDGRGECPQPCAPEDAAMPIDVTRRGCSATRSVIDPTRAAIWRGLIAACVLVLVAGAAVCEEPDKKDEKKAGRRQPKVLNVEEAQIALARVQVRAYLMKVYENTTYLYAIREAEKEVE